MPEIAQLVFNPFQEKTIIVWKEKGRCVVIDPGFCNSSERSTFISRLDSLGLVPEAVLLTHAHADHIFGVGYLQDRYGVPVYIDSRDIEVLSTAHILSSFVNLDEPDCSFKTTDIKDGSIVKAAGMRFKVISTPGHTPGGVCYLMEDEKILFCGDTLFAGAIGRTDFKYGDYDSEIRSIMEKLIILDPSIKIYPGHGHDSTIGEERTHNPFLEPFNEPEEEEDPDLKPVVIRESDRR